MNKTFKITDDSGFMALVNVDTYDSFVKKDWTFDDLQERFIQEMTRGNLLIWSTGQEGCWNVSVTSDKKEPSPFRSITGVIQVTQGKLFLTNYEDLSMAAQFQDEKLPQKHNAHLELGIENGWYNVQINQLFDPDRYPEEDNVKVHFEIVIKKMPDEAVIRNTFDRIPWQRF